MINETFIRLSFFIFLFAAFAVIEFVKPFRKRELPRSQRWPSNIALVVLNSVLLKVVFPTSAVMVALENERQSFGLLNQWDGPGFVRLILSLILMDLIIYAQHVIFHKVPLLWKLHRMHHADVDLDVTSGSRFHSLEIILSMFIKIAAARLLGLSADSILIFEIILNGMAMFNHSNFALPDQLDHWLRLLFVTPNMHRIHHSTNKIETDTNYGFNLAIWDRLFNTYKNDFDAPPESVQLGQISFRSAKDHRLDQLLLMPLKK